jgi:hypothetical protein
MQNLFKKLFSLIDANDFKALLGRSFLLTPYIYYIMIQFCVLEANVLCFIIQVVYFTAAFINVLNVIVIANLLV